MTRRRRGAADIRLPRGFWTRWRRSPRRLLLLDYDGTLAPFRVDRHAAAPFPGVAARLAAIAAAGDDVAVISGRPAGEVARFLPGVPVRIVGEHGWEARLPDGRTMRRPLPRAAAAALARAAADARAAGHSARLERKRTALVLHTRGWPRARARRVEEIVRRLWSPRAADGLLRLVPIDGGLELRATLHDKGAALRSLVATSRPGTFAVYLGDDLTDEDAFRAARRHGCGIRVGPARRRSAARGRITGSAGVAAFLARWQERMHGPRARKEAA